MIEGKFFSQPYERTQINDSQKRKKICAYLSNAVWEESGKEKVSYTQIGNAFYNAAQTIGMEPINSLLTPVLIKGGIDGIAQAHNQSQTNPRAISILQHYAPDTVDFFKLGIVANDLKTYQDILTDMTRVCCVSYESSGSDIGLSRAEHYYTILGIPTEIDSTGTRLVPDSLLQEYLRAEGTQGPNLMPRWDVTIKFAGDFLERYRNHPARDLEVEPRIAEIKQVLER